MTEIILNRIQCNICKEIIISHHRHDFKTCSCCSVSVDGGRAYLRRLGDDFTELSVTDDCDFELIRHSLYRGSRGKNGDHPLTWMALSSISNNYLKSLIVYQEENGYTDSIDYKFQLQELGYRKNYNIHIEE